MAFRLFYRFSYVSLLGPHNEFHAAMRAAFQLERMLDEISGDVAEINELLRKLEAIRHAARFRLATSIGAAAVAFLTSNAILTECFEMIFERSPDLPAGPPDLLAPGLSLLIALAAAIVAWRRLRNESGLRGGGLIRLLRAALRQRAQQEHRR